MNKQNLTHIQEFVISNLAAMFNVPPSMSTDVVVRTLGDCTVSTQMDAYFIFNTYVNGLQYSKQIGEEFNSEEVETFITQEFNSKFYKSSDVPVNESKHYVGDSVTEEEVESESKSTSSEDSLIANADDKALRYNSGKPKWSLVHFPSLEPLVKVLEFGAKKYEAYNWMKPMDKEAILESLMRHLISLFGGEEFDKESELPHIGHILANAMFYSYHSTNE